MSILMSSLLIGAIIVAAPAVSEARVSLGMPLSCEFQDGQFMDPAKDRTYSEKAPLEWIFFDLLGAKPAYLSGGDTGSVSVHRQVTSDGLSMLLKQGNGAHLFSLWPDGTAFWSKHNDIGGRKATQQFRGACKNVRKTD